MTKKFKQAKEKLFKHSLRKQFTLVFVSIEALTILACLLINSFFLEKYYLKNKEKDLLNVFDSMSTAVSKNDFSSEAFDLRLQRASGKYNVSIIVISSLFEPIKIYANEPEQDLLMELKNNLLGIHNNLKILDQQEKYVIVKQTDKRMGTDYIEMWGNLPDESFFMMRTAVESIQDSVAIANRFLLYVGIGAIIISTIVIQLFTRRISKPILEIADISEKMADMDFTAKANVKNKTELAVLGKNINLLSERLENTIMELKSANLELEKDIEKKTEVDEMRKEFLSNVSHELKTPLALIQGYAEGLKEGVNEADERDYYCDIIIDEASKMNSMVKKLLTLNQLEFGNNNINMEHFDLVSLVKNYVSSAEILSKQGNVEVSVDYDGEIYVWADEFMVEEAFSNYFSNALHYAESPTQKRIDVSFEMHENRVKVIVFNTGNPIPDDAITHLFEKFYKVDKARTREYGGNGVGLSIVKAIMDELGQECGVENSEGGVKFWFTLDTKDRL